MSKFIFDWYHLKPTLHKNVLGRFPTVTLIKSCSAAWHVNTWSSTATIPCTRSFYACCKRNTQEAITDAENVWGLLTGIRNHHWIQGWVCTKHLQSPRCTEYEEAEWKLGTEEVAEARRFVLYQNSGKGFCCWNKMNFWNVSMSSRQEIWYGKDVK